MTQDIKLDPRNYRRHNKRNKDLIRKSLVRNGTGRAPVVDNQGYVIAGNGVVEQAQALGIKTRVIPSDGKELIIIQRTDINYGTAERKSMALDDNITSDTSDFDMVVVCEDFDDVSLEEHGLSVAPASEPADNAAPLENNPMPAMPMSVIDTRRAKWKHRRTAWQDLMAVGMESTNDEDLASLAQDFETSSFDPVMAELVYNWFAPTADDIKVLELGAHDYIFGYVIARLGADFTGFETRPEQVAYNNKACAAVGAKYVNSLDIEPDTQDLIFFNASPAKDKDCAEFLVNAEHALNAASVALKNNRFAAILTENPRGAAGYMDMSGEIIRIMQNQGFSLHNEIIVITEGGARRNMKVRRVGHIHKNLLIFYKGNTPSKDIPQDFRQIKFEKMEESDDTENLQ